MQFSRLCTSCLDASTSSTRYCASVSFFSTFQVSARTCSCCCASGNGCSASEYQGHQFDHDQHLTDTEISLRSCSLEQAWGCPAAVGRVDKGMLCSGVCSMTPTQPLMGANPTTRHLKVGKVVFYFSDVCPKAESRRHTLAIGSKSSHEATLKIRHGCLHATIRQLIACSGQSS